MKAPSHLLGCMGAKGPARPQVFPGCPWAAACVGDRYSPGHQPSLYKERHPRPGDPSARPSRERGPLSRLRRNPTSKAAGPGGC